MNRFVRAGLIAAAGLLVLGGVVYLFRLEIALKLASVAADRRYQVGPTQEIGHRVASRGRQGNGAQHRALARTIGPQHQGPGPRLAILPHERDRGSREAPEIFEL